MKVTYEKEEIQVKEGTTVKEALKEKIEKSKYEVIGCRYNNEYFNLNKKIEEDANIKLIDISDKEGAKIYRMTLVYIMGKAFESLYPKEKLTVEYQLGDAMFCKCDNVEITAKFIKELKEKMQEIIEKDLKIEQRKMTREEAKEFYEKTNTSKGRLQFDFEENKIIDMYFCENYFNYSYDMIADTTGKVKVFDTNGKETSLDYNTVFTKVENTSYKINISVRDNKVNYSIYKNNEKKTNKEYNYIEYLYDNYFLASNNNGKLGVIDEEEDTKIQFKYNTIQKIENMNLIKAINDTTKMTEIYSKDMEKITELENATVEVNDEYIKIYNDSEAKYITKDGQEIKDTDLFTDNKIFAKKQGSYWGFVDKDGKIVVDFKYDKVTEVNKYGFAGIEKSGKWGVINKEGKIILEPKYTLKDNEQPEFIGQYYKFVYGNGEIYYTNN